MCNSLHEDSQAIRKTGKGWKLFSTGKDGRLGPLAAERSEYRNTTTEGWVVYNGHEDGFCFFLRKADAMKAMGDWYWQCVLRRIQYAGGLGRHQEYRFISGSVVDIALCTEFKILEEEIKQ